jgi:1,4-dihydroxy-2-naphthoate polyprenyltransferase
MQSDTLTKPSKCQSWFLAARPKTLVLSIVPIVVGTVLAVREGSLFHWGLLISALLSSLMIQIAVNLINDALDFKKGIDNSTRLGPQRATQNGWLSFNEVYWGGLSCLAAACVFGIPLVIYGGVLFLVLLALSSLMAYCYTGGPYPLAYHGLGELFVIAFFGVIGTVAGYYIQSHTLTWSALLAGLQVGSLAASVNAINNLRDMVSDGAANKKTWAVRFGITFARCEITFLILAPYFLNLFWIDLGFNKAGIFSLVTLPLGFYLLRSIWYYKPSKLYNSFLAMAALLTFLFSLFLSIGFWL